MQYPKHLLESLYSTFFEYLVVDFEHHFIKKSLRIEFSPAKLFLEKYNLGIVLNVCLKSEVEPWPSEC